MKGKYEIGSGKEKRVMKEERKGEFVNEYSHWEYHPGSGADVENRKSGS